MIRIILIMNVRGFVVSDKYWKAVGADRSEGGMWDKPITPLIGYFKGEYEDVLASVSTNQKWIHYGKVGEIIPIKIYDISKEDDK